MATDAGVRNIGDLRNFGQQLQKMGEQMYTLMQQAQQRLNTVSEGWHDTNNDKFKVRFADSVRTIKKMSDDFTQYNNYIKKTCEILEQYKGNNINF